MDGRRSLSERENPSFSPIVGAPTFVLNEQRILQFRSAVLKVRRQHEVVGRYRHKAHVGREEINWHYDSLRQNVEQHQAYGPRIACRSSKILYRDSDKEAALSPDRQWERDYENLRRRCEKLEEYYRSFDRIDQESVREDEKYASAVAELLMVFSDSGLVQFDDLNDCTFEAKEIASQSGDSLSSALTNLPAAIKDYIDKASKLNLATQNLEALHERHDEARKYRRHRSLGKQKPPSQESDREFEDLLSSEVQESEKALAWAKQDFEHAKHTCWDQGHDIEQYVAHDDDSQVASDEGISPKDWSFTHLHHDRESHATPCDTRLNHHSRSILEIARDARSEAAQTLRDFMSNRKWRLSSVSSSPSRQSRVREWVAHAGSSFVKPVTE